MVKPYSAWRSKVLALAESTKARLGDEYEAQSGVFELNPDRAALRITSDIGAQYIRSFDWDQFTPHRFFRAPDLAVWEFVALRHELQS